MDIIKAIKERRSVRKYKNEIISKEIVTEIIELAKWAPSWGNMQIARYTAITSPEAIAKIAFEGLKGFVYNMKTLEQAKNVMIISYVIGKSNILGDNYFNTKSKAWEEFDAGIACQTFCLAAHAKGISTCILGAFDHVSIHKAAKLTKEETIAAVIIYGYEEGNTKPTSRKPVDEILRFVD